MKAKELLKEIVKAYPDVVAISQDLNTNVYAYYHKIPEKSLLEWVSDKYQRVTQFQNIIEWDSENWEENIVTINDLENEVQGESKV